MTLYLDDDKRLVQLFTPNLENLVFVDELAGLQGLQDLELFGEFYIRITQIRDVTIVNDGCSCGE